MNRIRARVRGVKATDIFLTYSEPDDAGSSAGVDRRCVVRETVVGNLVLWRAVFTECLAVFLFVLLAAGSSVPWPGRQAPSNLHVSLSFGLVIASLAHGFGGASGAHLNPAVTLPLVACRRVSLARGLLYVTAQCLGGYLGAAALRAVTPADPRYDATLGCTLLGEGVTPAQGFAVELVATFQLVFAVFSAIDPRRQDDRIPPALAIGASVAIGLLFAVPFTGASMNPARSFGPALSAGNWSDHWLYWVAPLLAGLLASTVYRRLFAPGAVVQRVSAGRRPPGREAASTGGGDDTEPLQPESSLALVGERLALTTSFNTEVNNNLSTTGSKVTTDV